MSTHAIVEVLGHSVFAGKITEERREGFFGLLRVDIPETPNNPAYTKRFGASAVFCVTPCSKSVALRATEVLHGGGRNTIPIYDPEGLGKLRSPMEQVDLPAAREASQDVDVLLPF